MMKNNKITFVRYGRKEFLTLLIVVVLVLSIIYLVLPKGFFIALFSAIIYVFVLFLIFPIKYVLTSENTLETHFLFGKRESKIIKIDAVLEMRIEKIDKLIIRYMKEGFSQPTSTVLELSDQDIKNVQHELLKRNPNISLN
ncbi:hypothetical protein [Petrimonas sp.]|uniref:hypothetical protein n=1 Tax=Petrimonas sp. TaxID=2023866 RepID=UPI003F50E98B